MTKTQIPVAASRQITIPSNIIEQIELALEIVPGVTVESFVIGSLMISARDAISDTDWLLAVLQEAAHLEG